MIRSAPEREPSKKDLRVSTSSTLLPSNVGPRNPRDKLLDYMKSGDFFSAYKISRVPGLENGKWMAAIGELIDFGFKFARRGNLFTIRRRLFGDAPQDLMTLMAGVDATKDEASPMEPKGIPVVQADGVELSDDIDISVTSEEQNDEPVGSRGSFDVGQSSFAEIPEIDTISLGTDPKACVMSASATLTSTMAVLAKKSSGKTYLAMSIVEEMLRLPRKMPFVVIDPTGVWWGLLAMVDGTPSPYQVLVLGGEKGLSISHTQGSLAADIVQKVWPIPVILDVSDMLPEDQHQFVSDFGSRLYSVSRKALHVFIDEADEFAPQFPDSSASKYQKKCLGVIDRMVRRGRKRGIGVSLITQRPAVIHKNVLSQIDRMFLLLMGAPQDLDAVDSWMKGVASPSVRNDCLRALPTFAVGEAFCITMSSKTTPVSRFVVKKKETYDSSRTPDIDDDENELPEPKLNSVPDYVRQSAQALLAGTDDGE
jgi:hypothetical protein